jgi:phosphohistidine phosphatase
MKMLLLLRHAKSSWKQEDLDDHDRPLNKRGKRDAPRMGQLLAEQRLLPDLLLSSTACRARQTTERVIAASGYRGETRLVSELYHTDRAGLVRIVASLPDHCQRVLLVGHNPTLEEFLELVTGQYAPLTTAALSQLELPIANWAEFTAQTRGQLQQMWQPRELE